VKLSSGLAAFRIRLLGALSDSEGRLSVTAFMADRTSFRGNAGCRETVSAALYRRRGALEN
jgi:hypothetical protein